MTQQKLYKRIKKQVGQAIGDFCLIEEGDRIAVGVSGGKDSYCLLHILEDLRKKAPIPFELIAVNIDSGFQGYRKEIIEEYLKTNGFTYHMESTNGYEIIESKLRPGSSYCAFCARLRRGTLYKMANEQGCNKIALGHHLDDFIETLMLNQFYSGRLAAMSPKLLADNGRHTVIRPLVYVEESDIIRYSHTKKFPIVSCACPANRSSDQKRQKIKNLVSTLTAEIPELRRSMISALGNIHLRHLLDRNPQFDQKTSH